MKSLRVGDYTLLLPNRAPGSEGSCGLAAAESGRSGVGQALPEGPAWRRPPRAEPARAGPREQGSRDSRGKRGRSAPAPPGPRSSQSVAPKPPPVFSHCSSESPKCQRKEGFSKPTLLFLIPSWYP